MPPPDRYGGGNAGAGPVPAVFPEIVVVRTVNWPPSDTLIPPPSPDALLPVMTASWTVRDSVPPTRIPPPPRALIDVGDVSAVCPPVTVTPDRAAANGAAESK